MIDRIKQIAQHYNLASTAFADKVEIARPVISHIFSERNRPSLEVIQKIGIAFPEVDLAWILYGKGEMLKKEASKIQEPILVRTEKLTESVIPLKEEKKPVPSENDKIVAKKLEESGFKKKERRAKKIVFFYEDNTFEEFYQ